VQLLNVLLYILLAITSLFLICLVLIQRGKGGGLAGAFGAGTGSSSAFGTKAGDVFTRVTMITAGIWITLNMLLVVMSNRRPSAWATPVGQAAKSDFTPSGKATGAPKSIDLGKGTGGTAGESIEKALNAPLPDVPAAPSPAGPANPLLIPPGTPPATAPAPK